MNNFPRPVVCGIFPRSKSFDNSISREKTTSRSRSPLNRSPRTTEIFFTPPTSPSVPHNQSPFKTPPTSPSPQHRASSPVHSWEDVTKREVYLKCESDFSNPNGAMSSLLLSGSSKARDVFLFPSKQLTSSERDTVSCLKTVLPPLNMCRFWSDDEISLFEENILKLSKVIQKSFPHRSITIKAHYLLVHTITFIKRFRSYGLFNEQALENLHQIMFRDEVKYIHLNKQEELKLGSTMDFQNIGAIKISTMALGDITMI
jgi:hypothetical protein